MTLKILRGRMALLILATLSVLGDLGAAAKTSPASAKSAAALPAPAAATAKGQAAVAAPAAAKQAQAPDAVAKGATVKTQTSVGEGKGTKLAEEIKPVTTDSVIAKGGMKLGDIRESLKKTFDANLNILGSPNDEGNALSDVFVKELGDVKADIDTFLINALKAIAKGDQRATNIAEQLVQDAGQNAAIIKKITEYITASDTEKKDKAAKALETITKKLQEIKQQIEDAQRTLETLTRQATDLEEQRQGLERKPRKQS